MFICSTPLAEGLHGAEECTIPDQNLRRIEDTIQSMLSTTVI